MSGLGGERASRRWAKARALLIAYFVLFNVLAAVPTPGDTSPGRLERPFEREELRRWTGLFRAAGVELLPEQLASAYLDFSRAFNRARAVVLTPIDGWQQLTQTGQNWRLFAIPDEHAHALRVTAHSMLGDEVLYESGDSARRYSAGLIEYRRIRGGYNPTRGGPPSTYAGFSRKLSEQIFENMPHVERVTVALVRSRIPLPGHEAAGNLVESEPRHVLEFSRPGP